VTDDTGALQAAIDSGCPTVYLADKNYYTTAALALRSNLSIIGKGAALSRASSAGVENTLHGVDLENINIEGVRFTSTHDQASANTTINGTDRLSNIDALHFQYVKNLIVRNCEFANLTTGVKIDENLDDVTTAINKSVYIVGCRFDESVCMPIYTGGLTGCRIESCEMSAYGNSTKLCHHIYISSACEHFYVFANTFKGGMGQVINAGSAYTGAKAPANIYVFNNRFVDFKLLLSVVGGEVYFTDNVCYSTVATNCIYITGTGTLKLKNCDINVNTKLLDTNGFNVEMDGCVIRSDGIVFGAGTGSSLTARACTFNGIGNTSAFDITADVAVVLRFKNCVFNTVLTGAASAFVSRHKGCVVVIDGCTVNNKTLKNFATASYSGQEYIMNTVFSGFSQVVYLENALIVEKNNTVLPAILY